MRESRFIAIDPGRGKCGIAVMTYGGEVISRRMSVTTNVVNEVFELSSELGDGAEIVVGNGTGHKDVISELSKARPDYKIVLVDEKNTTLIARKLYEKYHPRPWPLRLVPFGLITEPDGIDAYAAEAIGFKHIYSQESGGKHSDR